SNRHNFLILCLWRGAQKHLARCAVLAVKGGLFRTLARRAARAGATRRVVVQKQFMLLESARRAARAGAARSIALSCSVFFWCWRGARR
ncbi:hypothetical protein A2U01_0055404, partial [Trifolium medium]|nr:hypothetical protein [Trifolium medium]